MKKLPILISIVFLLIIAVFTTCAIFLKFNSVKTLNEELKLWGVYMNSAENFTIEKSLPRLFFTAQIQNLIAEDGLKTIKITRISNVVSAFYTRYYQDKFLQLDSLFVTSPAPYFGTITQTIECPDEFKPKKNKTKTSDKDENELSYYILYANDRLGYGVCSRDLIKNKALYSFIYCSNKKVLYQIEIFIPPQEPDDTLIKMISSFKCRI